MNNLLILLVLELVLASLGEAVVLEVPCHLQFCSSSATMISFPEALFTLDQGSGTGRSPFPTADLE